MILISTPKIGVYIVNPVYLFKEAEQYRQMWLNRLLTILKMLSRVLLTCFEALGIY